MTFRTEPARVIQRPFPSTPSTEDAVDYDATVDRPAKRRSTNPFTAPSQPQPPLESSTTAHLPPHLAGQQQHPSSPAPRTSSPPHPAPPALQRQQPAALSSNGHSTSDAHLPTSASNASVPLPSPRPGLLDDNRAGDAAAASRASSPSHSLAQSLSEPSSSFSCLPLVAQLKQLLPLYLTERSDLGSLAADEPLLSLVSSFSALFQHHHSTYLQPLELSLHRRLLLSFPLLATHCAPICPDFAAELHEKPTLVLPVLAAAAHHAALLLREAGVLRSSVTPSTRLTVRLLRHSPLLPFRCVNSRVWNRYVSFRCQVVKTSPTKPDLLAVRFSCKQCGASVVKRLHEGRYAEPKAAEVCGCLQQFSSGWKVDRTAVYQTDWQLVRVQEMVAGGRHYQHSQQDDDHGADRNSASSATSSTSSAYSSSSHGALAPRFFDCELRGDLVDQLIPGDVLIVSGILRHSEFEVFSRDRRERRKEWSLYMDANAINVLSRKEDSQLLTWITFENDEVARIMQLLHDTRGQPFKWCSHTHYTAPPFTIHFV